MVIRGKQNLPDIIRISQMTCPITHTASKLLSTQTVMRAMCVCRSILSLFLTLKEKGTNEQILCVLQNSMVADLCHVLPACCDGRSAKKHCEKMRQSNKVSIKEA